MSNKRNRRQKKRDVYFGTGLAPTDSLPDYFGKIGITLQSWKITKEGKVVELLPGISDTYLSIVAANKKAKNLGKPEGHPYLLIEDSTNFQTLIATKEGRAKLASEMVTFLKNHPDAGGLKLLPTGLGEDIEGDKSLSTAQKEAAYKVVRSNVTDFVQELSKGINADDDTKEKELVFVSQPKLSTEIGARGGIPNYSALVENNPKIRLELLTYFMDQSDKRDPSYYYSMTSDTIDQQLNIAIDQYKVLPSQLRVGLTLAGVQLEQRANAAGMIENKIVKYLSWADALGLEKNPGLMLGNEPDGDLGKRGKIKGNGVITTFTAPNDKYLKNQIIPVVKKHRVPYVDILNISPSTTDPDILSDILP